MASRVILSNSFEKQWIQNHPQYLSGLSRALFPTTFLEIAVNVKTVLFSWNYYKQHFMSLLWYLNFLFIPPDSLDDTVLLLSTSWMSPIISFTSLTASTPNLPYKWANCYSEGMNSNKTTSVIRQTREKVFYHLPNTENMGPTMAVCLTWYKQNSKLTFLGHNIAGGNRRWRDEPKADPNIFIRSSVLWNITVPSFFDP